MTNSSTDQASSRSAAERSDSCSFSLVDNGAEQPDVAARRTIANIRMVNVFLPFIISPLIELLEGFRLSVEQEMFQKLSLLAKDRHLLYFILSTSIDDAESIKGGYNRGN